MNLHFASPYMFLLCIPWAVLFAVFVLFPRHDVSYFFPAYALLGTSQKTRWHMIQCTSILWLFVLLLLIVAAARPQKPLADAPLEGQGIDIALAVDTSGSMRALDFSIDQKRADRLEAVKSVLLDFIEHRKEDRLSLVVFGSVAFTHTPLTLDYEMLKEQIRELSIAMAGDETAIGDAVAVAANRLKNSKQKSRIIILLTDGKNTAGKLAPKEAADAAKALGIKVYTIGIGKKGMVPFPVDGLFGRGVVQMPSDLDEDLLKDVAERTGAQFFRAYDREELAQIYASIDRLERSKVEKPKSKRVQELFAMVLAPALLLGLLNLFLGFFYSSKEVLA